jgi:hypothetical protein
MECKATDYLYLYHHHVFQSCDTGHNVKLSGDDVSNCWGWHFVLWSVWRQDTDLDPQQHRCENLKCRKLNDSDGPLGTYRWRTVPHRERNCSAVWCVCRHGHTALGTGPLERYSCVLLVPLMILMAKRVMFSGDKYTKVLKGLQCYLLEDHKLNKHTNLTWM